MNLKELRMNKINIVFKPYINIFIFLFISIQSFIYLQHITGNYKLLNEYRYIDEITILENDKEISNHNYMNNNLLFDPNDKKKYTSKYDLEVNKIHTNEPYLRREPISLTLSSKNVDKLFDTRLIHETSNYTNSIIPILQDDTLSKLDEKIEFVKSNSYEQYLQILDRYYFHENSFILSPINEMNLGKDNNKIFSQYGFLSISIISSIMDVYGGFSINNFEKAKQTINLIYYIIAVLFSFVFFKNNYLRFGFILLLGIALFENGYYPFSYAPTLTNSRHLLDLLTVLFLYKYVTSSKNIYMMGAVALSIISILIAKDFGQFLFLSMIGTLVIPLIIKYIKHKTIDTFSVTMLLTSISFGVIAFKYYPMMPNPSIKYFLDGFYSFPFSNNLIFFIVIGVVFLQWLILLTLYEKLRESKYLYAYIFVLFYTEFLYLYFIWHGSVNNIIIYIYIYAIPFMIVYDLFNFKYKRYLSTIIIFLLILVYVKALSLFINQKKDYDNVFVTHKVYKWEHPRTGKILSTYSFDNFQDSINLIKKYSSTNEIYMISKYDNILGILSEKYSGFKFFELRSSIVTKIEFNDIKNQIDNEAEILFVDNDIERDFDKEMRSMNFFDLENYWRNESLKQRIPKLKVLKEMFVEVKNEYNLIEKGKMISVYKKKL